MNNHYETLGVAVDASPTEIKSKYRALAKQHHPDTGGDQATFQNISAAYEVLSDPNKRAEYDQMRQGRGPNQFHGFEFQQGFNPFGPNGPFGNHPFEHMFNQRPARNRDLNIQCQISLLDAYAGKQLEAKYRLLNGNLQTVLINVPAGIHHGMNIHYQGLGDDSNPGIPRGNLNVTVLVQPNENFSRDGNDLFTFVDVTPIDAMIGCSKTVKMITGEEMPLNIRAGVETGVEYAKRGHGFPDMNGNGRGRFVIVIRIKVPTITDESLVEKLKQLNEEIYK